MNKEFTEEQLTEVEKFASLFYSIVDIAVILELDCNILKNIFRDQHSQLYKRYMKGFLTSDAEIRMSEIALAKRGSTPAQESVRKYTTNARIDNK
jgi:hypothetical protein